MSIWHITWANMKKKKGSLFSIMILILLAVMFLNIGIRSTQLAGQLFDKKHQAINGPDYIAISSSNTYKAQYDTFMETDERVAVFEKEEVIYMDKLNPVGSEIPAISAYIFDASKERQLAKLIPVESVEGEEGIYLPIVFKNYGHVLGEDFSFNYKGNMHTYKIVGFFETTYYGIPYGIALKYFLTTDAYKELYGEIGVSRMMSVKLQEGVMPDDFAKDFVSATDYGQGASDMFAVGMSLTSNDMKDMAIGYLNVMTGMIIVFALIIIGVVLVVIRFKVKEYIETNMKNIGSLQAMGYTSRQLSLSIGYEMFSVTSVGGVLGTVCAYLMMPVIKTVLTKASGLIWINSFCPLIDVSVIGGVMVVVMMIALIAVRSIHKIPPIVALRQGIQTHYFKRNVLPIDKLNGSIHVRLACKQLISNMKANLVVLTMVVIGTFSVGFMMMFYINFAYDHTALLKMTGFEVSDIQVQVTSQTDAQEFAKVLESIEGVRKTNLTDLVSFKTEEEMVQYIVTDDFSKMEVLDVVEGSVPQYDNEVVITKFYGKQLGKTIGDTIQIEIDGVSKPYYISGFSQTTNGGKMGLLHLSGVKRLIPQFKPRSIDVYIEENIEVEEMISYLESTYKVANKEDNQVVTSEADTKYQRAKEIADAKIAKLLSEYGVSHMEYAVMVDGKIVLSGNTNLYKIEKLTNLNAFIQQQLLTYTSMMTGMIVVMFVVTLVMIGAILRLIIKSLIQNQSRMYGVYKAMGYTTFELMNQMSLSFMIVTVIGAVAGVVLTFSVTNQLLSAVFDAFGANNIVINMYPGLLIGMGIVVSVFVYGMAMLTTYRMRHITAYELLVE